MAKTGAKDFRDIRLPKSVKYRDGGFGFQLVASETGNGRIDGVAIFWDREYDGSLHREDVKTRTLHSKMSMLSVKTTRLHDRAEFVLRIRSGYWWNGSPFPWPLRWKPLRKKTAYASLIQDAFYQAVSQDLLGEEYKSMADGLYEQICVHSGVWKRLAPLLRFFASCASRGRPAEYWCP